MSETCLIRADSALLLSLVLSLPVSHSAHNSALNLRFRRQRTDTEAELSHTHISCQSVFVSLLVLCFFALSLSLSPSFPLSFSCEENIKRFWIRWIYTSSVTHAHIHKYHRVQKGMCTRTVKLSRC